MEQYPVSVIIPAYNSQATIGLCLKTLLDQSLKPIEIIVVDDGSADGTKAIVKNYKAVTFLSQKHRGPGAARNLGASRAQGKIYVFIDSDMEFSRDFLAVLTRPIRFHRTIGTWSGNEWVKNWDNVWARCWNYNNGKMTAKMTGASGQKRVFRAVLAKEFHRVGGFDSTGYTDDWTLVQKLAVEPVPTTAKFWHYNPETLVEVFTQAKWIGKRHYKLGKWGIYLTIFKRNAAFSVLRGLGSALWNHTWQMVSFQLVYDLGISYGALLSLRGERY